MVITLFEMGAIGTNCYLAWDEESKEAFLIDPAVYVQEIPNLIEQEGLELKYLILTHGHGDHIGGVKAVLEKYPECKLVAGTDEKELLSDPRMNHSTDILGQSISLAPDIFVNDGDVLNIGSQELKIITTPGHTPGGISILAGEALFSGDTLFYTSIGRTDLPGGNYDDIISSIKNKLYKLPDDTIVLPGHMGQTSIGFEKQNNMFV
jgi:glyoxylase-like metal-dependent hydrolase (beta-lactamase superfamily II)